MVWWAGDGRKLSENKEIGRLIMDFFSPFPSSILSSRLSLKPPPFVVPVWVPRNSSIGFSGTKKLKENWRLPNLVPWLAGKTLSRAGQAGWVWSLAGQEILDWDEGQEAVKRPWQHFILGVQGFDFYHSGVVVRKAVRGSWEFLMLVMGYVFSGVGVGGRTSNFSKA